MLEKFLPDPAETWVEAYGDLPPLGYALREALPNRWSRFHALPESKRYADTPAETSSLLERANTLAEECLKDSSEVWLIRESGTHYRNVPDPSDKLDWRYLLHWEVQDEPDSVLEYDFEFTRIEWKARRLDWLFKAIADDITRALFFSLSTRAVFAPYDGGFDLILPTPENVAELERAYGAWMSARPDKL